jgi:hypothetical protein
MVFFIGIFYLDGAQTHVAELQLNAIEKNEWDFVNGNWGFHTFIYIQPRT